VESGTVGSVLGSKLVTGIVVHRTGAPKAQPVDPAAYRSLLARLQAKLKASPLLNPKTGTLAVHGTPIAVEALGKWQALRPAITATRTSLATRRSADGR
jgi:aldehyde:ferredoxin oxidoreductase